MRLPQTVGVYRLVERLGSGSFGTVYRAEVVGALGFSQDVAVKVLDPARAIERPDMVASLADEAALLSRLQHPNIVQVRGLEKIEHDFLGTTYAMVMELVRGIPLRRLIDVAIERGHVLPVQSSLLLLSETAEALQYAHAMRGADGRPMNFVHRDMKPGNVLVTKDGRTKILDFGIAFAAERKVTSTAAGMTKGTVLYMSPEQVRGLALTGKSDIYSLGLVLFEMLTGELFIPLPEGGLADIAGILEAVSRVGWYDRVDLFRAKLRAPAPEGHGLSDTHAEFLEILLAAMLQPDPDQRADATRLVEMLEEFETAWRLKRGRGMLKELVRAEYGTFGEGPAVQGLAGSEASDEELISSGQASLEPPKAITTDGRLPGGPPKPVASTRIVPAQSDVTSQGLGPTTSAPPRPPEKPRRKVPWVVAVGIVLLLLVLFLATRGEEPEPADVLPPLTPATTDATPEPTPEAPGDAPDDDGLVGEDGSAGGDSGSAPEGAGLQGDKDEPPTVAAASPASRRPSGALRPKPTPKETEPPPEVAPPADVEAGPRNGKRARVWLVHDPPRFVVPGAPLTLAVTLDARGGGELCEPRAVLAPKSRRKYRRYRMRQRGADRWEATIDIPYDDQWAQGVRYFMECCWEEDCPVRWRGPGAPYNLDAPDF